MRRSLLSTVSFVLKILMSRTKSLKNHGVKVHGKKITVDWSSKKFSCRLCYSRFDKAANLNTHISVNHKDEESFLLRDLTDEDFTHTCSDCGLKYVSKSVMDYHSSRNHNTPWSGEAYVRCKICAKVVKRDSFLSLHTGWPTLRIEASSAN